jgi:hypothetical protein
MAPYIIFYRKIHHHWLFRIFNVGECMMWAVFFLFIRPDLRFYGFIFLIVAFPYLLVIALDLADKKNTILKVLFFHYVQLDPARKSCEFVFYKYKKHYRVAFDMETTKIYIYYHKPKLWPGLGTGEYFGRLVIENKATNTSLSFCGLTNEKCEYIISRIYNRPFNETTDTIVTVNDNEFMNYGYTFNEAESEII